jgi:hypothetical protein
MSLPASDSFTGSNGASLSGSWTNGTGAYIIDSNAAVPDRGSACVIYWTADTFNDDQTAQVKVIDLGAPYNGVGVRCATNNGYCLMAQSGTTYMGKVVSGSFTQIGSGGAVVSANDVIKLKVEGTTLTPYKNGSVADIGAQTDSAFSSGSAGLIGLFSNATTHVDDWVGDNVATGGGGHTRIGAAFVNYGNFAAFGASPQGPY